MDLHNVQITELNFNFLYLITVGASCRIRISKHLAKEYPTIIEAEERLCIDYVLESTHLHVDENIPITVTPNKNPCVLDGLSPIFDASPFKQPSNSSESLGDISNFITTFKWMSSLRLKKQLVKYLYKLFVIEFDGMPLFQFVQPDFL